MPDFEPGSDGTDDRATKEALKLAAGDDLEEDGKRHANVAILILFWFVIGCLALGISVYTWQLLTPRCWHFIDAEDFDKLQTILASALLSSALTGYAKQRLSK